MYIGFLFLYILLVNYCYESVSCACIEGSLFCLYIFLFFCASGDSDNAILMSVVRIMVISLDSVDEIVVSPIIPELRATLTAGPASDKIRVDV